MVRLAGLLAIGCVLAALPGGFAEAQPPSPRAEPPSAPERPGPGGTDAGVADGHGGGSGGGHEAEVLDAVDDPEDHDSTHDEGADPPGDEGTDPPGDEGAGAGDEGDEGAREFDPIDERSVDDGAIDDTPWDDQLEPDDGVLVPDEEGAHVEYLFEDLRIEGHTRVSARLLRAYVPFDRGDVIDPENDQLEAIEWAVRGTGWFRSVRVRLERGSRRGWVDLVIEVEDQNTVTVQAFNVGIAEGLSSTRDRTAEVLPYVGFSISESNVLGRGHGITLTGLMSEKQQALRFGFQVPSIGGSRLTLRTATSLHNGREFYGNQPFVSATCGPTSPPGCLDELAARNVVVFYRRASNSVGVGRTIGSSTHVAFDWVTDVLYVSSMPEAASEVRGLSIVPIDFGVSGGRSLVSTLRLGLTYDHRDEPNLTRRGLLVRAQAEIGSRVFGSSYDYSRLQGTIRGYIPLPKRQVLRLSAFAGIATGNAPFFTLFHVSDLTDLIPSRVLEMDIDRRSAPNLLGTSIAIQRAEEFAARMDVQWELELSRGGPRHAVRGAHGYVNLGVYMLSDLRELSLPAPGYSGFARLPVDMTFDMGVRVDTDIGLFEIGFSNLLGFIDLR